MPSFTTDVQSILPHSIIKSQFQGSLKELRRCYLMTRRLIMLYCKLLYIALSFYKGNNRLKGVD
jgi:hypothetical protein